MEASRFPPGSSNLYVYVAPVTGLGADTTYQFKVGATNVSGTTWSSAVRAHIPGRPNSVRDDPVGLGNRGRVEPGRWRVVLRG